MLELILALALQATTPAEPIKGADLPSVTGPQAPRTVSVDDAMVEGRSSMRLRAASRRGNVPAVAVPEGCQALTDRILMPAGWKAYQLVVPGKGSVQIDLSSDRDPAFKLYTINKWGRIEEGMLQNKIYKGRPTASYTNPKDTPNTIFVVVDTTETGTTDPYTLHFSWK